MFNVTHSLCLQVRLYANNKTIKQIIIICSSSGILKDLQCDSTTSEEHLQRAGMTVSVCSHWNEGRPLLQSGVLSLPQAGIYP